MLEDGSLITMIAAREINTSTHKVAVALGVATLIQGELQACEPPLSSTCFRRIVAAATLGQSHIITDSDDEPVALFTWAWMTTGVLASLHERPTHLLHISEWREGPLLVLVDLFVRAEGFQQAKNFIDRDFYPNEQTIYWSSRRGPKIFRRSRLVKSKR